MTTLTITPTALQQKAMSLVALDAQDWLTNMYNARADAMVEEVSKAHYIRCLTNGWPVPQTTDALLDDAIARGTIQTAAQIQADSDAATVEAQANPIVEETE